MQKIAKREKTKKKLSDKAPKDRNTENGGKKKNVNLFSRIIYYL